MDRFEEAVLEYISAKPSRLLKVHFYLPFDQQLGTGGSCPDFLVLDFDEQCVYIVEVTTTANIRPLLAKVNERQQRWYAPIQNSHDLWPVLVNDWAFRVCLILRPEVVEQASELLLGADDVSIKPLDEILFPWRWDWQTDNTPANPLR